MSGLGPISKRISLGRGLNTHPDPTVLGEGELQVATRVRFHKGVVYKDKGVLQYGADTDATTTAQGIGYHFHPTDPRILVAADGDVKLDSDGAGTAWTDIKTGLDATADVCFAGQAGATFIANGVDKVCRYAGGSSVVQLIDFPRPDDTPMTYSPTPDDVLISACENVCGIKTVHVENGGTGYSIGNELVVVDATKPGVGGKVTVLTVSSGVVQTVSITDPGYNYTTGVKATTGGAGTCTIHIETLIWAPNTTDLLPTADYDTHMYGSGSLRISFLGTGSNGDRVDWDLGATATIDLSESDYLAFWVKSDTIGDFLVFKMSEDNSTWQTKWINIPSDKKNVWVQVIWDLRSIAPSDRDGIRYFRIGTPVKTVVVVNIDHIVYCGPLVGEYQYAVSFYEATTGESGPIGVFKRFATQEPDDLTQTLPSRVCVIPAATVYLPPSATGVRLYRTMAGASGTFYHIADIVPSANTWTYTDTTPDNDLDEADAIVLWPGTCPRSKWLVPHADRMLHVGGVVVASRSDAHLNGAGDPLNTYTAPLNKSPYPPLPIYGHEFYVQTGDTGTLSFALQRTTVGGSSWTTVATSTGTKTWASTTAYQLPFTISSYGDIMFDPERYDWRILVTARPTSLRLGNSWDGLGTDHPQYRLLCYAHNLVFMSNLGQPDKLPPMDTQDEDVNEMTGGYFAVGDADGQKITAWVKHGSDILFLKERLTYLMTGLNMDDEEVALVHPSLGCKEWRTAIDCDGSAVWMAADRQIYIWESETAPQMLSKPIEEFFDGLTDTQVADACAVYSERRYYLFLPAAPAGSRCRYYDFDERAWATGPDLKVYAAMAHGDDPSVAQPYLLRVGATNIEVVKLNNAESEEGGDVTWAARSRADDFADIIADISTVKRLRGYRLWVKGTAADTITTKWYVDRGTTATRTYTDTIPSGTGFRAITRYPHNDIMGENLAVEVGGAHDTETAIGFIDLWLTEVR